MQRGFTLVELSVVLIIVSLMLSFGLEATQSTSKNECYAKTRSQLRDIQFAIDKYVANNARYPMPASLTSTSGVNDPELGMELAAYDANKVQYNSQQYSQTAGQSDISASSPTAANRVVIGALPFRTLGLPFSYSADCWGNRFRYMVTEYLTVNANYIDGNNIGSILVETGNITDSKKVFTDGILTTSAAYVVISHGANGAYAAPRAYTGVVDPTNQIIFCNSNPVVTPMEYQNCDRRDNIVVSNTYRDASGTSINSAVAENRFDDLLVYASKSASAVTNQNCSGTTVYWGYGPFCASSIGDLTNGTTVTLNNDRSLSDAPGTARISCNNGKTILEADSVCGDDSVQCTMPDSGFSPISWGTSNHCRNDMAHVGNGQNGDTYALTNQQSGYSGSATIVCNGGPNDGWTVTSSSCDTGCIAKGSVSLPQWDSDPSTDCKSSLGYAALKHGASTVISNTNTGYVGSITAVCNNGTVTLSGATCAVASGACNTQTVSWTDANGGNCYGTATGPVANNATSALVTNTSGEGSGSAIFTCNNGAFTFTSGTCTRTCNAQLIQWTASQQGGNQDYSTAVCSATTGPITEGSLTTISNSAAYRTGSIEVSCSNGIASYSGTGAKSCSYAAKNLYCWGNNNTGQLGDGTNTEYRSTPTPVLRDGNPPYDLIGVAEHMPEDSVNQDATSPTNLYTCGRMGTDTYCWGDNSYNQLGNGSTTASIVPTILSGGLSLNKISLGSQHACGITTTGAAYCWGLGTTGRLGNGTNVTRTTPYPVSGGRTFSSISVGQKHSCGLTTAGVAYCWGSNAEGQLGNGSVVTSLTPTAVSGGLTFSQLGSGRLFNCGIANSAGNVGKIFCWGACEFAGSSSANLNCLGNMGTSAIPTTVPTEIYKNTGAAGSDTYSSISVGNKSVCAIRISDGATYCWGYGLDGRLGTNLFTSRNRPTKVYDTAASYGGTTLRFTQVSVGNGTACGLTSSGAAYCWGDNSYGQLGTGAVSTTPVSIPTAVTGGRSYTDIAAGYNYVCAYTP